MERFFNTAGPVNREDHYYIEPLNRIDLNEILSLIAQKKYFVLHAPRQTGKTTLLKTLMAYLNKEGHYKTLHVNVEAAQAARGNVENTKGRFRLCHRFRTYRNKAAFKDS